MLPRTRAAIRERDRAAGVDDAPAVRAAHAAAVAARRRLRVRHLLVLALTAAAFAAALAQIAWLALALAGSVIVGAWWAGRARAAANAAMVRLRAIRRHARRAEREAPQTS